MKTSVESFKIFKEGYLLPDTDDNLESIRREIGHGSSNIKNLSPAKMPKVAIGYFEMHSLKHRRSGKNNKSSARVNSDNSDHYIIQFPINFYPTDFSIEDVRFAVNLSCADANSVRVVDLYPRERVEEIKRDVKLNISPSLTFAELSVKAFDIAFSFVYDEIRPVIYGSGVGLPHAYWNMRSSFGHFIAGAKVLHAIIKVPHKTKTLTVDAELQASLQIGSRFLNTIFGVEDVRKDTIRIVFDLESCEPIA